jgi:hypothetical protein
MIYKLNTQDGAERCAAKKNIRVAEFSLDGERTDG